MSQSHQSLDALSGSMLGISTIIMGLRFYARSTSKARFRADDWVMIPAYLFLVALIASMFCGTHYHTLGYPTPIAKGFQTPQQVAVAINRAIDVFAAAYFGCVKASALLFFRRVFCVHGRSSAFSITIWVLLVITFIWTILFILLPIFQCHTNFAAAYSAVPIRSKYCTIGNPYIESQSVTAVVFDLVILILPIPKIWALKISSRRRLAIVFVFSTAVVALAASIAKAVIAFKAFGTNFNGDLLLATTQVYFMWVLEAGFAMIAINLPTIIWLRTMKVPERMLASVRSFLSISSSSSSSGSGSRSKKSEASSRPRESSGVSKVGTSFNGSREGGLLGHDFEPLPENNLAYESTAASAAEAPNIAPTPQHTIHVTKGRQSGI